MTTKHTRKELLPGEECLPRDDPERAEDADDEQHQITKKKRYKRGLV